MSADLFISYAWTSKCHRDWVCLLASHLHLIGYDVKIDEDVDYGSSLHGFMREVTEAAHVLLIVDEDYIDRANNKPESGVGIETKWLSSVFLDKPATWLSVVFVRNPECKLPNWLNEHNPKGFNFNSCAENNNFPGSLQLEKIWRWVEGLPANKANAVPLAQIRKRAARLERVDASRDPGLYANPAPRGNVTFKYGDYKHYTVGYGDFEFKIQFSGRSHDGVYVYRDGGLKGLGLITEPDFDRANVESFITPGRTVTAAVGQSVVLLNFHGIRCIITIDEVQDETNSQEHIPGHVIFTYEIQESD